MGDRGIGNLRLLNGLAIQKHALLCFLVIYAPPLQALGRGSRHLLAKSHARWLEKRRKELSSRDLAAKA